MIRKYIKNKKRNTEREKRRECRKRSNTSHADTTYPTYCVKVRKKDAEKKRIELQKMNLLDYSFFPKVEGNFVFFPINKKIKGSLIKKLRLKEREGKKEKTKPKSLREVIEKLGMENFVSKSFDIIGDIAIIETKKGIEREKGAAKKIKKIAQAILEIHPNVKTVAKKEGPVSGIYRIRKIKIIAGKKRSETIHTESGCRFKLDISKVYYSPRLAFERQRIANLIKENEKVFVPFAGVGPFAIIAAKKSKNAQFYANELNPVAFNYLVENIKLNKLTNIIPIKGDAKKVLRKFAEQADRVIMPIPMSSNKFLDVAFLLSKKGTIVHFYYFAPSEKEAIKVIKKFAKKIKRKVKILFVRKVRAYSPIISEYVVDFLVSN